MRLFAMLLVKDAVIMSLCIAESATTLIAGELGLKAFGNCACMRIWSCAQVKYTPL